MTNKSQQNRDQDSNPKIKNEIETESRETKTQKKQPQHQVSNSNIKNDTKSQGQDTEETVSKQSHGKTLSRNRNITDLIPIWRCYDFSALDAVGWVTGKAYPASK